LPRDHPYQRNQNLAHFNGEEEHRCRPKPVSTIDTLRNVAEYETWLAIGNIASSRGDLSKVTG